MTTAVVIRPGETDYDVQERIQGSLNLPLNARGVGQTASIIDRLRGVPIEAVFASPTEPALSVAREIARALDVPLKELSGLENLHHGLWQGMLLEDLKRKHPRVYKQWRESPESVCPPEGETCQSAWDRVRHALRKPAKRRDSFAVVASEPVASLIACALRGHEPHLPGPVCGCDSGKQIERIELTPPVNGTEPHHPAGAAGYRHPSTTSHG